MEQFSIQSLPEIIVVSHREVIPSYDAIGKMCVETIGPEMQRLGCKCPPPGYCFTVEHNEEYTPTNIDIEYCEQVEEYIFRSIPVHHSGAAVSNLRGKNRLFLMSVRP